MLKTDFGDAKNTKDEYIDHEFSKELMNHDWFDILWEAHGKDGLNLIGWPWHTNIGGFVAEEILGWGPDSLRICSDTIDEDLHPSEAGHKALGEWYNEKAKA